MASLILIILVHFILYIPVILVLNFLLLPPSLNYFLISPWVLFQVIFSPVSVSSFCPLSLLALNINNKKRDSQSEGWSTGAGTLGSRETGFESKEEESAEGGETIEEVC